MTSVASACLAADLGRCHLDRFSPAGFRPYEKQNTFRYSGSPVDESRNRNAMLIAAAIIVAPRLKELKDTPPLRAAISDAIRVAEFIAKAIDSRDRKGTRPSG